MSQRNDTTALIGAFLITAALVGGGFLWFTQRSGLDLGRMFQTEKQSSPSNQDSQAAPTGEPALADVKRVPSGLFNYGGSTSWAPIRLTVDSEIQAVRPEFRLRYVNPVGEAPGSAVGIRMLLRDQLAFAQSSRPLTDQELQQAEQRGIRLKQIPVAIDGLAVAVNPNLNVTSLSLDQLAAIYRGEISNWQELGGPNQVIQPLTRPVTAGGTIELFVEDILRGKNFGRNVRRVATTTEALRQLSNSPGGIYFASAPEIVPQCTIKPLSLNVEGAIVPPYQEPLVPSSECPSRRNQLNIKAFQSGEYPLTRNLYVVVKQNGRIEEQAGDAYVNFLLTEQAQEQLAKAGFVKIR